MVDCVSMAKDLLLESMEAVSMSLVLVAMLGSAWRRVEEMGRQVEVTELVVVLSLVSRWLLVVVSKWLVVEMAVRWEGWMGERLMEMWVVRKEE